MTPRSQEVFWHLLLCMAGFSLSWPYFRFIACLVVIFSLLESQYEGWDSKERSLDGKTTSDPRMVTGELLKW